MSNKVHRLCFDFETKADMTYFYDEFVAMNMQPDGNDYRDTSLVEKDSLHPKAHEYLVRTHNPDHGNGRVAHRSNV